MSLELFINSGSITEIDLSRIDGVRFEDAFSVSSTTCATLYYNVQDFSIPPVTPVGVLNIPETNYFMFDENAASDWNATTPTKIRISLKALGRILDRTNYQQKLFDIIKNRRVDSEITLTKLPTLNDSDPKSLKKFKITEANYLERTYDDDGQKFYSLEWGGTDLTETADFTGLFDYLPSSEDRKDGFFTLTVQQLDSEVNNDEPPSQGDELLICIKPSAKYGLLDVVDSTFDTITVDNIRVTSGGTVEITGSMSVSGSLFINDKSLDTVINEKVTNSKYRTIRRKYTKAQYVAVPKWATSVVAYIVGGGGGGGAGVDINDAHFTLGGSGGSGGSVVVKDYTDMFSGRFEDYFGIDENLGVRRDWVIYVNPGAGGKGGTVANNLVIENENDAYQKLKDVWNGYWQFSNNGSDQRKTGEPNIQFPTGNSRYNRNFKYGMRPYFYGLNIDYAYNLIVGGISTIFDDNYTKETANPIIGTVDSEAYRELPLNTSETLAAKNLKKMYVSNGGGNGAPSFAVMLNFTRINREPDPVKKSELLLREHKLASGNPAFDGELYPMPIWEAISNSLYGIALGGSGGNGGIAIKYSKNNFTKIDNFNWNNLDPINNIFVRKKDDVIGADSNKITSLEAYKDYNKIDVINKRNLAYDINHYHHWSNTFGGILPIIKKDITTDDIFKLQGHSKLYNPIPFVESAATEMVESYPVSTINILIDPWKTWNTYPIEPNINKAFSKEQILPKTTEYVGGYSGYGVSEPLFDSFGKYVAIGGNTWGTGWYIPKIGEFFNRFENGSHLTSQRMDYYSGEYLYGNKSIRRIPADGYLHSAPNARQDWITEDGPPGSFMKVYNKSLLFSRVKRYITIGNDPNAVKIMTPYSKYSGKDKSFQGSNKDNDMVGILGGAGGLGWTGFLPFGKHKDTEEIIDIMDMPPEYFASLRTLSEENYLDDFVFVNFYNIDNAEHVKIGKGGIHRKNQSGDRNFQVGGNGGNAIRRWKPKAKIENPTLFDFEFEILLDPTLPTNDSGNIKLIRHGAGGGAGGSGGIDINITGNEGNPDTIQNNVLTAYGGVRIDSLLDENNEWLRIAAQDGKDGMNGCVIIEFSGNFDPNEPLE